MHQHSNHAVIAVLQSMARRTAAPPVESIISVDKKEDNNRSKL
jgi:hypothetical protein